VRAEHLGLRAAGPHRCLPQPAILIHQVHEADIREARHHQVHETVKCHSKVERCRQHVANTGDERERVVNTDPGAVD